MDWKPAEFLPRPSVSLQDAPERRPWRKRSIAEVDEVELVSGGRADGGKATRVCLASVGISSPSPKVIIFNNKSLRPVRYASLKPLCRCATAMIPCTSVPVLQAAVD